MGSFARRWWTSLWAAMRRAQRAQRRRNQNRSPLGRALTVGVCALAGLLVITSAAHARGIDLRPGRNTDLVSLVQSQSRRNVELGAELTRTRAEVDALSAAQSGVSDLSPALRQRSAAAGLTAVTGPGLTVTLDDAPDTVAADGLDPDLLVVHQQDIQSVVNILWRGGAEAMTIQGQRVIATTGVKCVGNTVVLHGIPYAPPYVISAIGDRQKLRAALGSSPAIAIYQQYVDAFGLVYRQREESRLSFAPHQGSTELRYAARPEAGETPSDSSTPR